MAMDILLTKNKMIDALRKDERDKCIKEFRNMIEDCYDKTGLVYNRNLINRLKCI